MKWLVLALWPVAAIADDCTAPQTQQAMNSCAAQAYDEADAELNVIYRRAVDAADSLPDGEEMLRDAQRAWIAFRDAACDLEALSTEGGSMQPLIFASCLERLTWARIDDLDYFLSPLE